MSKLIQICASENDLFGLDGDGAVYQYNFKTNSWTTLGHDQRDGGDPGDAGGQAARVQPRSRQAAPPARG
jgi:hypothetical protein